MLGFLPIDAGMGRIGVAFQTYQPHLVARQHSRIRRAVRFMTSRAALHSHHRMLVYEGAALVAMALQAAGLISKGRAHGVEFEAAVGIVAIHTRHGALLQPMRVRPVEGGPLRNVAARALRIDLGFVMRHQLLRRSRREPNGKWCNQPDPWRARWPVGRPACSDSGGK